MNGVRNSKSWEKQWFFNLDNNFEVCVEYSVHYGEFISRINLPKGQNTRLNKNYWHCSDGLGELPDFAKFWIEEIKNEHGVIAKLVRPNFSRN